ncbi:MAG TPA: hypothetical protein VF174_02945 [Micromonosporaceae bacterium]
MSHDPPQVDEYVEAAVQRLLTEESDLAEQGIAMIRRKDMLVLSGEVESHRRRDEIVRRVRQAFPDIPLLADIGVTRVDEPSEAEELG